ncbi:MAG TPA: LysM peptidoglycan-binding domain-containing protein, partial [Sorangium sp.]|nr:LysM peptidoglycan-binding domain-containing protein [Sorangium sp.]
DLAFAAYNMGYEQLLDRIDRYGTSDFAELARQRALPRETAAYVPKIVAAALVANNLERYGFGDVKLYKPVHFSQITVPASTPLATLAKAAGVSTNTIRRLNPHILGKRVPSDGAYSVFVPPESLSRAHAALPAMLDMRVASSDADVLLPDDLVMLGGSKSKRSKHNDWTEDENLLRFLPKPKRRSRRDLLSNTKKRARVDETDAIAAEFRPKRGDREVVMYRVGPGDTLIGVAKQFVIDVDDLAHENGLDSEAKLRTGTLLKLMVKRQVLKGWKQRSTRTVSAPRKRKKTRRSTKAS